MDRGPTSRLVAVLPQDDPLDIVSFEQFSERRLLTLANSYRIRHKIDMVLNDKGVIANEVLATNNSLNAILAAREGLGIAIVDPVSAYGIGLHGIKVIPTEQEIPYEWGLFRRVGQDDISFVDILRKGFLEASKKVSEQVL